MPYGRNIKTRGDFNINEVLYIDEGGNVGVGLDDANARLEVTGSATSRTLDVNKCFIVSGSTTNPRVGIGTSTPNAPLHIAGSSMIMATALSGSGASSVGEIRWSTALGKAYLWLSTGSGAWVGWESTIA